jgi:NADPH:quinone reductase-like Zn-dependent oxidoreductase
LKIGDRVAGHVQGGKDDFLGAFAEFVRIKGSLVFKVPENITMEQAATVPLAVHTASNGLQQIGLPMTSKPLEKETYLLIWSAATATVFLFF